MGRSTTPKYAMQMDCTAIRATDSCWRGRATAARLRAHLEAYNASLLPGGANARVGEVFGIERAKALSGRIILNNGTRKVIVEVTL